MADASNQVKSLLTERPPFRKRRKKRTGNFRPPAPSLAGSPCHQRRFRLRLLPRSIAASLICRVRLPHSWLPSLEKKSASSAVAVDHRLHPCPKAIIGGISFNKIRGISNFCRKSDLLILRQHLGLQHLPSFCLLFGEFMASSKSLCQADKIDLATTHQPG